MSIKNQTLTQETDKSKLVNSRSIAPTANLSQNPAAGSLITTGSNGHEDDYIKNWLRSLAVLHHGHWDAARYYEKVNLGLGITTAVTAAISGTTAFAQLQQQAEQGGFSTWVQVFVGVLALTAAALGAVQAFVRPSEVSARHKQAGQKYGILRREIELQFYLGLPIDPKMREQLLTDFRVRWAAVDDESLAVPQRIYDRTEAEYKNAGFLPGAPHSKKQSTKTSSLRDDNGINKRNNKRHQLN